MAIAEAYAEGYLPASLPGTTFRFDLHLHSSAGRYICGEETALINALKGKRATPRAKPPLSTDGRLNNHGGAERRDPLQHASYRQSWRCLVSQPESYSGRRHKDLWCQWSRHQPWMVGTPARHHGACEILERYAGGMSNGVRFRGLLPGGISTAFLIEEHLDLPLDFSSIPAPDWPVSGPGP
ncbi:MAG: hypothetical protein U0236_21770 [Nitrospira sp.]